MFPNLHRPVRGSNGQTTEHKGSSNPPIDAPSQPSPLPLFRPEVLEARSAQWMGTISLPQPVSDWMLSLLAFAIAGAVLLFLFFGSYTQHETVEGQLIPTKGLLHITTSSPGIILSTPIKEGSHVIKDQPLIEISRETDSLSAGATQKLITDDLRQQLDQLREIQTHQHQLQETQRTQLITHINNLNRQLTSINDQASLQLQQFKINQTRVARITPTLAHGASSKMELEQAQLEVLNNQIQLKTLEHQRLETENQRHTAQDQLHQLPFTIEKENNELQVRFLTIQQSLAQNEAQRAVVIKAPNAGIVANLNIYNGQTIPAGHRLLSIIRVDSPLQAELWLPSRAVGFLKPNDPVVLRYQAFPYQKFGQYSARITEISESSVSPTELSSTLGKQLNTPMYRVLATLNSQSILAYGKPEPLKPGMTLEADILLGRSRFIDWILEPLYGFTRSSQIAAASEKQTHSAEATNVE
jgi:membrane fusion protein